MNYRTKKMLFREKDTSKASFSYEYDYIEISIIEDDNHQFYIREYKRSCVAEGNGRPITNVRDYAYPIDSEKNIDASNWKEYRDIFKCVTLEVSSKDGVF